MKKEYRAPSGSLSGLSLLASIHGFDIDLSYDEKHGVSNEGIYMVDGYLVRPKSSYAQNLVKDTILIPVPKGFKGGGLRELIKEHAPDGRMPKYYKLVYEHQTEQGKRYSNFGVGDELGVSDLDDVLSHCIIAIEVDKNDCDDENLNMQAHIAECKSKNLKETLSVDKAIHERLEIETQMYSQWINNEVLKVTVKPKTTIKSSLINQTESRDLSYTKHGIYLYGTEDEIERTRTAIIKSSIEKAINSSGETFHLELDVKMDKDINILGDISAKLANMFGFRPIFKHREIVKGINSSRLSMKLALSSVPSIDVLIQHYVERGKLGSTGELSRDFIGEILERVASKMVSNDATVDEIKEKQLEYSILLNKWMMSIISAAKMDERKLKNRSIDDVPKDLIESVLFTVFKLAAPTNVIGLPKSGIGQNLVRHP